MLLWIEGFEGMGVSIGVAPAPAGILGRKYGNVRSEANMFLHAGRLGGYSLDIGNWNNDICTKNLTTDATLICGFAFSASTYALAATPIVSFYDTGTLGVSVKWLTGGELGVYRGSTQLGVTSGLGFQLNTWYYIELKVLCGSLTSGAFDLRVGGTSVLSNSATNTKAGTHDYHSAVAFPLDFTMGNTSGVIKYDDIYILDGSGSVNNDFLGNMKVVAIAPNADVSGAEEFTPSSAVDHYTLVDENPVTDDTDYVEDDTTDHRDLWEYGSVSSLGAIAGLQINTMVRGTDATSFDLKTPVQSNGVDSDGTGQTVGSTNYKTLRRIVETDPDTGVVWTMDGINAARFGVKVG